MSTAKTGNRTFFSIGTRQFLVALIALQVALTVPDLAAQVRDDDDRGGDLVRLETGIPAGTPLTIETGLTGALAYARQWAEDAYLFAAAMQIDWPTERAAAASSDIPDSGWILYTFGSSRDETMSILVDRKSGAIFDEQRMEWSDKPDRGIGSTTYPISSTTALFATETILGASFRQACPKFRSLSRVSFVPGSVGKSVTGESASYWLVSYEDARSLGRPAFTVRVDAENGSVHREDVAMDEVTTCET